MKDYLQQVSAAARQAVPRRDWRTVDACASEILKHDEDSAEGYFLTGLVRNAQGRPADARDAFSRAISLDGERYDAVVEKAFVLLDELRFGEAAELLDACVDRLQNSPLYLNKAGKAYKRLGLNEQAFPLFERAYELQPGAEVIMANFADACVFAGKIDKARELFTALLERNPKHQRNHLSLARLARAENREHVEQMLAVLRTSRLPEDQNVFMYYAIGKELEDLGEWDEAFVYFKKAGDAIARVADYDIEADIALLDKVIETCSAEWLNETGGGAKKRDKTPIFIVGLPRTGTTLTDRIIASHSQVRSVGETQFMQMVLKRESGIESDEKMTVEMIEATARLDIDVIGDGFMAMLDYRLGDEPMFVDKLPFNIMYLGYIAKAFPDARIVLMRRNPMDSCFSMYKQVFTWAYKFSYTLDGLGRFYVAYARLLEHWQRVLGDRLIEVEYEALVANQEEETRRLLDRLGLQFEEACLNFEKNESPTATASSVQVREKVHTRSVRRWQKYAEQLRPLREYLEKEGIGIE